MHNDSNTLVTVVIPNYNNQTLLENLLNSLQSSDTLFDLIIVDNASMDNSVSFIKENYPEVHLIENDRNMGFAYAVNQGIKESKTEYVFLLNNDTTVKSDTISQLLTTMNKYDDTYAVCSKMIQMQNPNLIDDAGDEYTILGWSKKRGLNHNITDYTKDSSVFSACAGAALYKKSTLDEIGLFDETFESYLEDMDLSFRAKIHGYSSYYSAGSIVYHVGSATTGSKHNPFKVKLSARNNLYLIYKNMPCWMLIINFIFILFGILVKYLFFMKKGLGNDYIAGIMEAINTKDKLNKTKKADITTYLKIEAELIINTLKYPF